MGNKIMFEKDDVFCCDCEHVGFYMSSVDDTHINCMLQKNKKTTKNAIRKQEIFGKCVEFNKNNDCNGYERRLEESDVQIK